MTYLFARPLILARRTLTEVIRRSNQHDPFFTLKSCAWQHSSGVVSDIVRRTAIGACIHLSASLFYVTIFILFTVIPE